MRKPSLARVGDWAVDLGPPGVVQIFGSLRTGTRTVLPWPEPLLYTHVDLGKTALRISMHIIIKIISREQEVVARLLYKGFMVIAQFFFPKGKKIV